MDWFAIYKNDATRASHMFPSTILVVVIVEKKDWLVVSAGSGVLSDPQIPIVLHECMAVVVSPWCRTK